MPLELVTIQVKVKGKVYPAKAPKWSTGLVNPDYDPTAEEGDATRRMLPATPLEVLAHEVDKGNIVEGAIFPLLNYAHDLKTRAKTTQAHTPKKSGPSQSALNQLVALWAVASPTTFTEACQEERQHQALVRFYEQIKRMNGDTAPDREAIEVYFPKCLESIEE